jgi:hypothetical protein
MEIMLPNKAQFDEMNENLRAIATGKPIPADYSSSPGEKVLLAGDRQAGFFGFVQPGEMGKIGASSLDFNGTNLALELGLSAGIAINSNTAWIKYIFKGRICFRPIKPLRHTVTWNHLYNAGIVYPTQNEGLLPPNGRMGTQLSISVADNSINTTTLQTDAAQGFLRADAIVANVGDVVTLKGWTNTANNGDFTVVSITANKIVLSGGTLVNESGNKLGRVFKKSLGVTQGKVIKVGGLDFRVRLMRGASNDPLDSYDHVDRDSIGVDNEWNAIILPLHAEAKLQNWACPAYAGTTQYWGTNLTDADLVTHHTSGSGNYPWCQETRDGELCYQRANRGYGGASFLGANLSWNVNSIYGWLPVLELL